MGHFLGSEAKRIGYGGIQQVKKASGAVWHTIKCGMLELEAGELYKPGERVRRKGGGRKKLAAHIPGIEEAVEQIVDPKGIQKVRCAGQLIQWRT